MIFRAGLRSLLAPLEAGELEAGPVARGTPAVFRVEGKEPRVELGEARAAGRTTALGRKHRLAYRRLALHESIQRRDQVHDPLAEVKGARQCLAHHGFALRANAQVSHRQLNGVLLEAREARPLAGGQKRAVDAQVGVASCGGPLGEVGVVALAVHHQRGEQPDMLSAEVSQHARRDGFEALGLDRHVTLRAVLGAELHIEQAQEMVELGERGDRALAAAAAGALLDRDGGRNAENRVHVGLRRRLHELARVGVQGFEVASLPFREQDIERQRGLAGAGDAGDHRELLPRDLDIDRLEVVFAGVVDGDVISSASCHGARRGRRLGGEQSGRARAAIQRFLILAQCLARVRPRVRHDLRRNAHCDDLAACLTALRSEVDDPVARPDDVEVVLDHHQRVAGRDQAAERSEQLRDVIEMQARGGLVEQEQGRLTRVG